MNDQTIPAVTDDDRRLARKWAESVESNPNFWGDIDRATARVILHAVPTPPPPTLADLSPEERTACQWMQADTETWGRAVIIIPDGGGRRAVTLDRWGHVAYEAHADITPRPHLPRMAWPSDQKPAPAPDLPGGWRLADHKVYGRVIVTSASTSPNGDGYVYILLSTAESKGYDWVFCPTNRLTFLDTGKKADQ